MMLYLEAMQQAVTTISSCQIDVISRQKIEQPGSIFLLVSYESNYGSSCSSYQEEIPRPGPLLTALYVVNYAVIGISIGFITPLSLVN